MFVKVKIDNLKEFSKSKKSNNKIPLKRNILRKNKMKTRKDILIIWFVIFLSETIILLFNITLGWTSLYISIKNPLTKNSKKGMYEEYEFILPGYNLRPGEMNASAGLVQLKKLDKMISIRRKNLELFNNLFKNDKRFIIQQTSDFHSSFSFPIILKNKSKTLKKKIIDALSKNKIEFRLITGGCFTEQTYSKYFKYTISSKLINATHAHYFGFFVGNSSIDLTNQINLLYKTLKNI